MRTYEEIDKLMQVYPPHWRRWCEGIFNGGCGCTGCVHPPGPLMEAGLGHEYPITKEEFEVWEKGQLSE